MSSKAPIFSSSFLRWLLLLGVALLAPDEVVAEDSDYRGKVFLGISGNTVKLAEGLPETSSTHGIVLNRVAAGSAAEAAGMQVGDVVVSLDGKEWRNEQIRLSRSFGKAGDKARPGEKVEIVFFRQVDGEESFKAHTLNIELMPYPRTMAAPKHSSNAELRPDLSDVSADYEGLCRAVIQERQWQANADDLLKRLDDAQRYPDPERLAIQRYVMRDPFRIEPVAREIVRLLGAEASIAGALATGLHCLQGFEHGQATATAAPAIEATYKNGDLNAHLEYVERVLEVAAGHHQRAFAKLTDEDADFVRQYRLELLNSFAEHKILSYDKDNAAQHRMLRLLDQLSKVNLGALLEQAATAALLAAPEFVASLNNAVDAKARERSVVAQRKTKFGLVRVAGTGRSRYQSETFAVLYELGGNDVYANQPGRSTGKDLPTSVVVDMAGDDAYESHAPFGQGCGDMGVGMLYDLEGDDSYIGTQFTQGTGFMGIGVLSDRMGNDIYRGITFHQGVALGGVGALLDLSGDDRYEAHMVGQGVGLPAGFGLLRDQQGDDSYYCKGSDASGYGTPGVFEGWGQGVGFGFRPYASGGVGVLDDRGGSDRMEAGNFSQGGGYYYGFGLLYGGGPDNDVYIGSRWAQGFGCHQATGAMIETGGNDRYLTRYSVAQGIAWDEATVFFVDESGDDVYEGGGFSQGAAAMNGWSVFIERAGNDIYRYTDPAIVSGNSYHGGSSLAFFVDAAGQDQYQKFDNNQIRSSKDQGIFVDLPDGKLDLDGDRLRALLQEQ